MTNEPIWLDELGPLCPDQGPWARPQPRVLVGRYCTLEPLDLPRQADELFAQMTLADPDQRQWMYLAGMGPFASAQDYVAGWQSFDQGTDNQTYAVRVHETGKLTGQLSLLRINPGCASIEVGFVRFPPQMQRSRASTEAQFLLADRMIDQLGYRRYEWKCNTANAPSMAAARRLGFRFEGTFRNDRLDRGRNRDTAWFSIINSEWPRLRAGYKRWLEPENFDARGHQIQTLSQCFDQARRD